MSKDKDKGLEITLIEFAMEGVMWFTMFFLFTLMGMETYGRLRNQDARFSRWLRVPQKFIGTVPPEKNILVKSRTCIAMWILTPREIIPAIHYI